MSFCPMKEVGPRTAAIRRSCFVATNVEIRSVTFCSFLQLCELIGKTCITSVVATKSCDKNVFANRI